MGSELIRDVWDACCKAYKCRDFHETEIKKNVIIIAFGGSQKVTDFITDSDFDECDINSYNPHFESMHDGDVENRKIFTQNMNRVFTLTIKSLSGFLEDSF